MAAKVPHVHLLFQSTGGNIGDGLCLYSYFRALTVDLTLYNGGTVASIATIAYLGAKHRKTSAYATFMIHRSQFSAQFAQAATLKTLANAALVDDERTEHILRSHITMPAKKWSYFNHNDLWFSAQEAVNFGIADSTGDFSPPAGTQIYTL